MSFIHTRLADEDELELIYEYEDAVPTSSPAFYEFYEE